VALDWRKIVKFLPVGFLQAVTGSLVSMAYALGTAPSLVVSLGKVYTPLVAIFSSCILGKYFMWLEWFSLVILTAASLAFGILGNLGQDGHSAPLAGMACVVGSATASCLMSLVMERLMKSEKDPFVYQKARLDLGSLFFSLLFLPLIGAVGMLPFNPRKDVAFWAKRPGPEYWDCEAVAVDYPHNSLKGCDQETGEFMVNWTLVALNPALNATVQACHCGSGLFLGWAPIG